MKNIAETQLMHSERRFLSPLVIGYMAMTAVLFIWSGFSLTVRAIGGSPLATADVALIRFMVPLLLLLPLLPSRIDRIKKIKCFHLLLILLGGLPFFLFAAAGAKIAPTAYMGAILAGTPALFVAVLSWIFDGQLISKKRGIGLLVILIGVLVMVTGQSGTLSGEIVQGVLFLFAASLVWAGYTMGLKHAGLDAVSIAIILSFCSFIIIIVLIVSGAVTTNFGTFSFQQALPFILIQGVGVGVISTIGYSYAVNQLGCAKSSTIGALSPGLTAVFAIPVFNELLSMATLFGICLATVGVILSNRS
jgi:drug/metabolite transporter (DMT)-like permease